MNSEQRPEHGQQHDLHVRQVDVGGRHPWVLEDDAGILEVADTEETLEEDHPELHEHPPEDDE